MKVKIAYSTLTGIDQIIEDLKKQLGTFDTRLVQFFATSTIDSHIISKRIHEMFNNVPTFGCTTAGEIISGQMLDNSVVLMAFGPEIVEDCAIEVMENITDNKPHVENAFNNFKQYFKQDMAYLDPQKYVGIVLIDGMCALEEKINERIGDLTNITFVGGTAGDDLQFKQTYVFANGKAYTNAVVLALIKSHAKFDFLKTQSFKSTNHKITITKAKENERTVMEINNSPAAEVYSTMLGFSKEEAEQNFMRHPVGLVFENDFFVRAPKHFHDNSIVFSSAIKEGMQLEILEAQDIVARTQKDLDSKIKQMGNVSAIINYNCLCRTLELKEKEQTKAYGKIFSDIPTIGFSTYGESYIGHVNQTAVMLIFN